MLQLTLHTHIDDFLAVAETDLARDEVANGLMLGVALRLRHDPTHYEHPPFLATVQAQHELIAAATMTPPHGLLVYATGDEARLALRQIAEALIVAGWPLPTVNGVTATSLAFAESWQTLTGGVASSLMELRVFELRAVSPPPQPAGRFRRATHADEELVFAWYNAFHTEAVRDGVTPRRDNVARAVAQGNVYLWEDEGRPVSLASIGRRTPHGASIGPVYTPSAQRGRGYASACVAALSQLILDEGNDFCTLFTDLANPTSNHIYQQIGYRPVCDFTEYALRIS